MTQPNDFIAQLLAAGFSFTVTEPGTLTKGLWVCVLAEDGWCFGVVGEEDEAPRAEGTYDMLSWFEECVADTANPPETGEE